MAYKVNFKAKGKRISFTAKGSPPKSKKHLPVGTVITKHNKKTGCKVTIKKTGRGRTGWRITKNVCPRKRK